jgi:hypothetical protein
MFVAGCLAAVSACAGDEDTTVSGSGVEVRDSAGVEIVWNHGGGSVGAELWRLEPDLQVGEQDGPLAFGRIRWVAPGPAEGMLVLDGQSSLVHVFDSIGAPVLTFGGAGEGPGEFRRPATVTRLSDGRYVVAETFPPVLHWVSGDGTYERTTHLPLARAESGTMTAGTFGLWQVSSGGRVFVQVQVVDPSAPAGRMPVYLLEVHPEDGTASDTLLRWTWNAGQKQAFRIFEPITTWMPRPDGTIALSAGSPYEIELRETSYGLLRLVRRDIEPAEVTGKHRSYEEDRLRRSMASGGATTRTVEEMLAEAVYEPTVPEVLRVWVSDPDGRLWIGVHDRRRFLEEGTLAGNGWANALDVFEKDGRYLGRLALPAGFRLTAVSRNTLYGVWSDELDVPFARRYRVEPALDTPG